MYSVHCTRAASFETILESSSLAPTSNILPTEEAVLPSYIVLQYEHQHLDPGQRGGCNKRASACEDT